MVGRSSVAIVFSVWRALFLREALHRFFSSRAAWVWLLLEPVLHIVFLMFLFSMVRLRVVGGIETAVWLMVGLLAFFMFRRTGMLAMKAIGANQTLFVYRQVLPVDTVLVRAALEGFLMLLIAILLLSGGWLTGLQLVPADPLAVLEAFLGLWLLGLGFALSMSVVSELVREVGTLVGILMMPLYLLSGVIFPLARVPQPYQDWLLLNPVAHALEAARLGFAPYYQSVPGLSMAYVYGFALVLLFLGLALNVRFISKLRAQ